jgi:hypothetical protein
MVYAGAAQAAESRKLLGSALEALQKDPNIPKDVLAIAENIAGAVGALFEAEKATSDLDGKASVKHAMGSLSQTMALLQDVKISHAGITEATNALAQVMSKLYPLAQVPTMRPSNPAIAKTVAASVPAASAPTSAKAAAALGSVRPAAAKPAKPVDRGPREKLASPAKSAKAACSSPRTQRCLSARRSRCSSRCPVTISSLCRAKFASCAIRWTWTRSPVSASASRAYRMSIASLSCASCASARRSSSTCEGSGRAQLSAAGL